MCVREEGMEDVIVRYISIILFFPVENIASVLNEVLISIINFINTIKYGGKCKICSKHFMRISHVIFV